MRMFELELPRRHSPPALQRWECFVCEARVSYLDKMLTYRIVIVVVGFSFLLIVFFFVVSAAALWMICCIWSENEQEGKSKEKQHWKKMGIYGLCAGDAAGWWKYFIIKTTTREMKMRVWKFKPKREAAGNTHRMRRRWCAKRMGYVSITQQMFFGPNASRPKLARENFKLFFSSREAQKVIKYHLIRASWLIRECFCFWPSFNNFFARIYGVFYIYSWH